MIIEGLLTTTQEDGTPHVAPMGPVVDADLKSWTLRPFQSSTTFRLLRRNPNCVFHVVDDVLPVVQAALGMSTELEFARRPSLPAGQADSELGIWIIPSACHWYHLRIAAWEVCQPRSEAIASVMQQQVMRPFWGWNRAKHAILEATILATRLHLIDRQMLEQDLARFATIVEKTAGPRERQAWELLTKYIDSQ